jgi:hypothetical protein
MPTNLDPALEHPRVVEWRAKAERYKRALRNTRMALKSSVRLAEYCEAGDSALAEDVRRIIARINRALGKPKGGKR